MSSDEESISHNLKGSDNEQENNEIFDIGEEIQDQEEQTEEVQRDETADGEGTDNKQTVKPKRVVRNPQPKLNEETLKGPRGITALESYFQRVRFKGKGKEQEDLNTIMKTYEYWCHRLFPKFPFDTCIERLEKLGTKRAVQTHIKRIRFDLIIEDKPILSDSDEEPNVEGFVDIQNEEINQQQDQFDQLLNSELVPKAPVELTEDQLERIKLNKEKAERLKQERLKKIRDKAEGRLQVSSQLPSTSGIQDQTELDSFETPEDIHETFSQEEERSNTDVLNDNETLFDHESNFKGKTSLKGTSIRKRSNILNNSEQISNENNQNDQVVFSEESTSNDLVIDMDENDSDSLTQKKKQKLNTLYDSDDDEDIKIKDREHGDSSTNKNEQPQNPINNLIHKNAGKGTTSQKRSKFNNLLVTDESDQDLEENSRSPENSSMSIKADKLNNLKISHSNAEIDADTGPLCSASDANGLTKENSSDFSS